MLPIIGISQQGVTNETEARRRWVSQNVKKLREAALRMNQGGAVEAAFAPKGNMQLIPNSYQMSRGSLPLASALVPKTTAANGASFGAATFANIGNLALIPDGEGYTGADMWRLIFGLNPGDQLTFPQIYGEGEAQTLTGAGGALLDVTRYTEFVAPRIVLKTSVDNPTTFDLDDTGTDADRARAILAAMEEWCDKDNTWWDINDILGNFSATYTGEGTQIAIGYSYDTVFAINNDDPLRAIGCIRSHKNISTSKWEYSTSYLVCIWADENRGGGAVSPYFGFTLINAAETYKNNVTTDAEGNFLQRGTDSNIVPESFT